MTTAPLAPRTILFLPASNSRAIEKARGLGADMVVLDLEDAVREDDKESARRAACDAAGSYPDKLAGIRINGIDSAHFAADLAAIGASAADYVVVPKVEAPEALAGVGESGKPILAMIETPAGVLAAAQIAAADGVAGLIVGTNDLAAGLRQPPGTGRGALATSLQLVVLAARARGIWAFDGVFNKLDDPEGLAAECCEGRALGFDGKSLIHPNQIEVARAAFGASAREVEDARALIEAATGGAERSATR